MLSVIKPKLLVLYVKAILLFDLNLYLLAK